MTTKKYDEDIEATFPFHFENCVGVDRLFESCTVNMTLRINAEDYGQMIAGALADSPDYIPLRFEIIKVEFDADMKTFLKHYYVDEDKLLKDIREANKDYVEEDFADWLYEKHQPGADSTGDTWGK